MGVVIVVKVTHTGSDMGVDSCCPNQTAGIIVYELIFSPGGGGGGLEHLWKNPCAMKVTLRCTILLNEVLIWHIHLHIPSLLKLHCYPLNRGI